MRAAGREEQNWWLEATDQEPGVERWGAPRAKKAKPKRNEAEARSALAEELLPAERDYEFTYRAARHEKVWLVGALNGFYEDSLIQDVLRIAKGGKEANVYCCLGASSPEGEAEGLHSGPELLAAKVYRPRMLRQLKNDALYRQGRDFLAADGKALRDGRSLRAIHKKTRVGSEMIITSWIEHEYQTLQRLHAAGLDVPSPVARSENAILMGFVGDEELTAPALNEAHLPAEEARPLFERVLFNIERMLELGVIHADLSAYNILYWEGEIRIIDFPQVVDPLNNPDALPLFQRDVERVCQYFARYGVRADARRLATDLWRKHVPHA